MHAKKACATSRVGLLGGSFDPIHRAHIELAKTALTVLDLDQVQLLPARQPWQKLDLSASAEDRLAMIKIAIDKIEGLAVNTIELDRAGKTYTLDTLHELPSNQEYFWIMGADQLQNFPTWHQWRDIAKLVTLAVAQRPGSKFAIPQLLQEQIDAGQARVQTIDFEPMDISSSQLRLTLQTRQTSAQWLDPAVADYITKKRLYQPQS